ncbi:MAG: hypothetical protein WC244_02590 [Patescibacteria group bacterium]|jgi:hypothetical protein
MKTKFILQKIKDNSLRDIENLELIYKYIENNSRQGQLLTFYNWECPPRFMDYKDGKAFINYDMDLQDVFDGKKSDEFTELPRVVESRDREIAILQFLQNLGLRFHFVKIIADTNAYYLTPESLNILGEVKIKNKFEEFKNLIIQEVRKYPLPVEVCLFTELMKPYRSDYDKYFNYALDILKRNPEVLLDSKIINEQIIRTRKHIGINENDANDFALRTIASYGAEGMIFDLLSQTGKFSNCVWFNIEEVDERTITITNCIREIFGKGKLPMVFLK